MNQLVIQDFGYQVVVDDEGQEDVVLDLTVRPVGLVAYDEAQALSAAEQAQARTNIGAVCLAGDVMTGALQVPKLFLGGQTSASPMLKPVGAALAVRLGDDAGDGDMTVGAITPSRSITPSNDNAINLGSSLKRFAAAFLAAVTVTGAATVGNLVSSGQAQASSFVLGGATSAQPGLFASGATLKARLADNSADAAFTAGAATFSGMLSVGANADGLQHIARVYGDTAADTAAILNLYRHGHLEGFFAAGVGAVYLGASSGLANYQDATLIAAAGLVLQPTGVVQTTSNLVVGARLQFVGTSSGFPMLKNTGGTLNVRVGDDSADAPMSAAAGTFSGSITVSRTTADAQLFLTANAGQFRSLGFTTAGSNRWVLSANATAESGANAGSDFEIRRNSDAGVYIDSPIMISRATGRIGLGGLTSAFPALTRVGSTLAVRLGDDSGDAAITAAGITASSDVTSATGLGVAAVGGIYWTSRSRLASNADGNIRLMNNAATGFNLLQFGGIISSFPAIKVSGAGLAIRLADDSAYTQVRMSQLQLGNGSVIKDTGDGNLLLQNSAATSFGQLMFGATTSAGWGFKMNTLTGGQTIVVTDGTGATQVDLAARHVVVSGNLYFDGFTSALPMLKNAGAEVQVRLGDDTALTNLRLRSITIDYAAGNNRFITFSTASSPRWSLFANITAETGGNAGSDLQLSRLDDTGNQIDIPFSIIRSSGVVLVPNGIVISTNLGGGRPAIFASGTTLKVRLGDNSADAPLTASAVTTSGDVTVQNAGVSNVSISQSSTGGFINVRDSAGVAQVTIDARVGSGAPGIKLGSGKNVMLNTIDVGSGSGVIAVANSNTAPTTNPAGGGVIYVEGGALKYRGSSGTVTVLAAA